jgi:hypothetical protein
MDLMGNSVCYFQNPHLINAFNILSLLWDDVRNTKVPRHRCQIRQRVHPVEPAWRDDPPRVLCCTLTGTLTTHQSHTKIQVGTSVADPGCLSRIPDPDPTIFWYPRSRIRTSFIPDPAPKNKRSEVIFQTKFNFSCFPPFLKLKSWRYIEFGTS